MKEEMNNEMDLLLRRLSRRQDGSMSNGGSGIAGEHLDADELNSYAEKALPAAARARYTEHLAECSSCRELVVQLSGSAGVIVAAEQSVKAPAPSGWRNFLASLFSPMVLRYAVPALGLIVVAAIGFFVMNRESGKLALRSESPVVAPASKPEESPAAGDLDGQQKVSSYNNTAKPEAAVKATPQDSQRPQPPVPNAPPGVSVSAEVKKDAPATQPAEESGRIAAAAQPKTMPTPVGDFTVAIETQNKPSQVPTSEAAKVAKERALDQARAEDRRADTGAGERSGPARNEAPSPGAVTGRARSGIASAQVERGVGEKEKDEAEVRSVAGRRFRRDRGLWIDTAYNSGTSTVSIARGSEQYRALIADEPQIKTIADQLDGELIVVWKSRAYRIR